MSDAIELHRMIDALSSAIGPIVTAHAESDRVHADKLEAQVDLVAKILEFTQPSVRALGTRPHFFESGAGVDMQHRRAAWRGLNLTRPAQLTPEGETLVGAYSSHVYLREDGSLVILFFEGPWNAQPSACQVKEQDISVEAFCRNYPVASDPKKLVAQLLGFMGAAGDRRKSIVKAREITDKLRAISTLLSR